MIRGSISDGAHADGTHKAGAVGLVLAVTFAALFGLLFVLAAPALAATPEAPETTAATKVTATSATLTGVLNPGSAATEPGTYNFRYFASPVSCEYTEGPGTQYTPSTSDEGHKREGVTAKVEGLLPGTTYTFCLVAADTGGEERGNPKTFTTSPADPTVGEERASKIGPTTATVSAEIGPRGLPTTYHMEYVSAAEFQARGWSEASRVPANTDGELPSASGAQTVSEELTGLQLGTEYHFRFVATNTLGTVAGSESEFTTTESGAFTSALPDGRTYELVSPADEGELYLPPSPTLGFGESRGFEARLALSFRAAANGDAIAWVGEPAIVGGTGETGNGTGNEWLSTRGATEWKSSDITPAGSIQPSFQFFTSDLTSAIAQGSGEAPLTSAVPAGCNDLYSRETESGTLSPLFSVQGNCGQPLFAGASEDKSQIIFQDEAALTENAQEATEVPPSPENSHHAPNGGGCMFGCNLYEQVNGQLRLINVLPGAQGKNGSTVPSATFGGYLGARHLTTFSHAISNDGSRIFWTDTQAGPNMGHVYVLENGTETVQVSGAGAADYWTATPDGRYAFYTENGSLWRFDTDTQQRVAIVSAPYAATGTGNLTDESNQATSVSGGQFHAGEHIFGPGIANGTTISNVTGTTLTLSKPVSATGTGVTIETGGAEVEGVVGVSETGEDGAYVYFVAAGALTPGATAKTCVPYGNAITNESQWAETAKEFNEGLITNQQEEARFHEISKEEAEEDAGQIPPKTGCNLYALHENITKFITSLAAEDDQIFLSSGFSFSNRGGDWVANLGEHTAEVTPDGRHLVLESRRPLTGYDNRHELNLNLEVYVYSYEGASFACASCDPRGSAPEIVETGGGEDTKLPVAGAVDSFSARLISENGGRVFFDSSQPLVLQDTNGIQDVYEWEREGEGTCTAKSATRSNDGCVFLLSGGTSEAGSFLVDSDLKGENVFFEHVGRLGQLYTAPVDENELYDARVNGGFPNPSLACTGTGCQGVPPGPPIFATPASVTFSGLGNFQSSPGHVVAGKPLTRAQKLKRALRACKKDRKQRVRKRCETAARKRYGVKARKKVGKAKKASNDRRTRS